MQKPYTVIVAGTTARTLKCAMALSDDKRFQISTVITPSPKPVGRKKIITKNPLHAWADDKNLPVILIEKGAKIDKNIEKQLDGIAKPDFLLVVDFGYLIPNWLLDLPKIASINVHPSALPRWRGSSPGQFAILFGDKNSAVSIMTINQKMDQGPILHQINFAIDPIWTQKNYYDHSFALASATLPQVLDDFATGKIQAKPQPENSPTPPARRLQKTDSYLPWEMLEKLQMGVKPDKKILPEILQTALPYHKNLGELLIASTKAFAGWPDLWTEIPTKNGKKRMKILEIVMAQKPTTKTPSALALVSAPASTLTFESATTQTFQLKKVHIAGHEKPALWNQVKTILGS